MDTYQTRRIINNELLDNCGIPWRFLKIFCSLAITRSPLISYADNLEPSPRLEYSYPRCSYYIKGCTRCFMKLKSTLSTVKPCAFFCVIFAGNSGI